MQTINIAHQTEFVRIDQAIETTINLSAHATLNASIAGNISSNTTVNIKGDDTANFFATEDEAGPNVTVNLYNGALWTGTLDLTRCPLTVNGGNGSKFNNNGISYLHHESVTIGTDIVGTGSFNMSLAGLELKGSVSAGQSIYEGGQATVQIDQPQEFNGEISLVTGPYNEIDLMGLANADSYTYHNDMLSIWSGEKVLDTLRLNAQQPFAVEPPTTGGKVAIVTGNPPFDPPPVGLPIHMGA